MARRILLLGVLLAACAGTHDDDAGAAGAAANSGLKDAPACRGTRQPTYHRPQGMTCDHDRPPSLEQSGIGCTTDAECNDGQNGRCGLSNRGYRTCNYDECFSDADCDQGGPCICGESVAGNQNNRCMPGNCKTNADCGANRTCSPSFGSCGNYTGVTGYYCHTCIDACVDDSECGANGYCAYEPTLGWWKCSTALCIG